MKPFLVIPALLLLAACTETVAPHQDCTINPRTRQIPVCYP